MLYTQANEICTHEDKNTIIADHVIKALEQLELHSWIEPVEQALAEFKESSKGASLTPMDLPFVPMGGSRRHPCPPLI